MLKRKKTWYNLPPLQKRILLHLAHTDPQTRNEVKKHLKKETKNILFSFNSLMKKDLVEEVSKKKWRQREFPQFWLTLDGVLLAIIYGTNLNMLKEHYETVYGKSEATDLIFDLGKTFPGKLGEIYTMFKTTTKGKMKLKNIPINNNEMQKFIKIVFRYPSYRKALKKTIGHAFKIMEKMVDEAE